jgi:hypothetical protein
MIPGVTVLATAFPLITGLFTSTPPFFIITRERTSLQDVS